VFAPGWGPCEYLSSRKYSIWKSFRIVFVIADYPPVVCANVDVLAKYLRPYYYRTRKNMRFPNLSQRRKILLGVTLPLLAVLAVYTAAAMLSVGVSVTGTVVGQTKEITISAQTAVAVFGTGVALPTCAAAAASSFNDVATASVAYGTSLQSNSDYETWFCLGNIGASAGTISASVSSTDGATYTLEIATVGTSGLTYTTLCSNSGAGVSASTPIAAGGVIALRLHVHTPTVGLNAQTALNGKISFSMS
jgi:hypothetical protein